MTPGDRVMRSLNLLSAFVFTISAFFFSNSAMAEEVVVALPVACSEQFLNDFDATFAAFIAVDEAINAKADKHIFRGTVVAGLNSCHSFVEKYVKVDPLTGAWSGEVCSREVESETVSGSTIVEVRSHKAECEYLQRLLDRAD